MATTTTQRLYFVSEFVAATSLNETIFKQELLDDSAVVEKPYDVKRDGNQVTVHWTGMTVSQASLDAVDAAVAAHVGGAFAATTQREQMAGGTTVEVADNTNTDCVTLDTGLLPAGEYDVDWYLEHKVDVGDCQSKVLFWVGKNEAAESQRATDYTNLQDYASFSGKLPFTIKDGESLQMKLTVRRSVAGTGNAVAQRARIFLQKVN